MKKIWALMQDEYQDGCNEVEWCLSVIRLYESEEDAKKEEKLLEESDDPCHVRSRFWVQEHDLVLAS